MKKYNNISELKEDAIRKGYFNLFKEILELTIEQEREILSANDEDVNEAEKSAIEDILKWVNDEELEKDFLIDEGIHHKLLKYISHSILLTIFLKHLLNENQ